MSKRLAETQLEREGLVVGAVLSATELERARRIVATLPPPAALQDPTARAALTLAIDMLSRGELPSAATVFVEGTAGANLFSAEDRERLRSWQAEGELTDAELVTIGRQLHRAARTRKLGTMFKALGVAVEHGRDKDGNPFGPDQARRWFDQIVRDYNTAHATGIKGSEAVLLTRARYEQEKKEGRSAFTRTGIPLFDKLFGGMPHKLVYLLGAGGGGKSTFLGTLLDLHQGLGVRSVLSSMEDNHEWPVIRHVALALGLKQRETYSGPFPDEAKALEVEARLHERWKNLTILSKADGRTVDDHTRLWAQYIVQEGASVFYIDNLTTLDHQLQGRNDTTHSAAARTVEKLAAFADTWHVTVVALAHTKNEWFVRTRGKEPPELNDAADTGGGIAADRHARLGLGVWSTKQGELRITCTKNTAEGRLALEKKTIAFDVHGDQGLFDAESGREVNLFEERRLHAEKNKGAKQRAKDDEQRRVRERNKAWADEEKRRRDAAAAAELAKQPAQGELLHVENPKERT
jgi:hypothetical protein